MGLAMRGTNKRVADHANARVTPYARTYRYMHACVRIRAHVDEDVPAEAALVCGISKRAARSFVVRSGHEASISRARAVPSPTKNQRSKRYVLHACVSMPEIRGARKERKERGWLPARLILSHRPSFSSISQHHPRDDFLNDFTILSYVLFCPHLHSVFSLDPFL